MTAKLLIGLTLALIFTLFTGTATARASLPTGTVSAQNVNLSTGTVSVQAIILSDVVVPLFRISSYRVAVTEDGCDGVHLHGDITVAPDDVIISDPDPEGCGHGPVIETPVPRSPLIYGGTTIESPIKPASEPEVDSPHVGGISLTGCPVPSMCPQAGQDSLGSVYLHSGEFTNTKWTWSFPVAGLTGRSPVSTAAV